jgi:hypothetical protein
MKAIELPKEKGVCPAFVAVRFLREIIRKGKDYLECFKFNFFSC